MTDLSKFIIAKSDQLNADDLIDRTIDITITRVSESSGDQAIDVNYEGDNGKPWRPCKSMIRVLVNAWGKKATEYKGRSLRLYRDPKVKFGGLEVGGIRISHMSHINAPMTMALNASKAKKAAYTVHPLPTAKSAAPIISDDEKIKADLRKEAAKGTNALKSAWVPLGGAVHQRLGVSFLDELKSIAAKADEPIELPEYENDGEPVEFDRE